ncbi:hypothetical protein A0J61_04352 [Choanephora cucurbitarum]|uniref:Uncharacterized protein n=1 Tax=Choanephora cucurbitarum TaxID=101091 RepID=A0A1C7NEW5_9FUNG|nr:hypothetical protein A0J61_04352 [Choanephora cucurbitarum]
MNFPASTNRVKRLQSGWRFAFYFVIACLFYYSLKALYHLITPSTHSQKTQQQQQKPNRYKQQNILFHHPDQDTTFHDFPWYQSQHTRPQFKPNASLLTTELSAREREIMQQKAILTAKRLAFKRFVPDDYKGIRGSKLTTPEEVQAFRDTLDCWTQGQWVHLSPKQLKKSFHLKHIQDPIYSTCDRRFYKTHSENDTREAVSYQWQPVEYNSKHQACPSLNPKVEPKKWCKVLQGRNMLLVGDLVHYQFHEVLLDAFRDQPTVCFGELNCKDHTICKSKDTRLRYVRNDILSTIRKFQNRDQGHPLANIVEWPFVTSNVLSSYPILILNRAPLLGDDDLLFTRRLIHTMKVIRDTSPDALVIYRSSFVGHPFCDDATQPLTQPLTDEELKRLPYGWSETKRRNAIAKAVIEAAGGVYIDFASMIDLRPDGHLGGQDCLRYCIPGPLDATVQVLYNVFTRLL